MATNDSYDGSEQLQNGQLSGDYLDAGIAKRVLLTFSDAVPEWPTYGAAAQGLAAVEYVLYVKPQQLQVRFPTRTQVMQTLGGAFVDTFGYGLPTGQLQGTFGWGRDILGKTGIERMVALKKLYEKWQEQSVLNGYRLSELIVASDQMHFEVFWGDLEVAHTSNSPFLVSYTLPFTVIRDRNGPADRPYGLPPVGMAAGGTPAVATA